jgi:phage gpG-like protein
MAKFEITINDYTDEVLAAVEEKCRLALSLMGDTVEKYAKEDCPVDTGNLRNSITHTEGDKATEYVGTNVSYAKYVEFIETYHHKVGKAHYLRDGAQNHINELKAVAEATLKSI